MNASFSGYLASQVSFEFFVGFLRSWPFTKVLAAFSLDSPPAERRMVVRRLLEMAESTPSGRDRIRKLIDFLENDQNVRPGKRSVADSQLLALSDILGTRERRDRALSYLNHPRSARRAIGLRILRHMKGAAIPNLLLEKFRASGDNCFLHLAIIMGAKVPDAGQLLSQVQDRYYRVRLIQQCLATADLNHIAATYPYEFAWAVGRSCAQLDALTVFRNAQAASRRLQRASFQTITSELFSRDLEILKISVWALGRLARRDLLARLAKALNVRR
jgi:hypothetical protein